MGNEVEPRILINKKNDVLDKCRNTDGLWKHYVKWKEASHQSPHIVGFHLHEMSKIGKSTETESRLVVSQGWRQVEWGWLLMSIACVEG